MGGIKQPKWFQRLLVNSRFWVIACGIVLSFNIAGFVQLFIAGGNTQTILVQSYFGFVALALIYITLLASPLTKAYPKLPYKEFYLDARYPLVILACYYALLHAYLGFFKLLDGPTGFVHLSLKFKAAVIFGVASLVILLIVVVTFALRAIKAKVYYQKLIHRLLYLAGMSILMHIIIIGPHYSGMDPASIMTAVGVVLLVWVQVKAVHKQRSIKRLKHDS